MINSDEIYQFSMLNTNKHEFGVAILSAKS